MSEVSKYIWNDTIQVFLPVLVEAAVYGSYTILMGISAYVLIHIRRTGKLSQRLLVISIIMFVISTTNMAIDIAEAMLWINYDLYQLPGLPAVDASSNVKSKAYTDIILARLAVAQNILFVANQAIGDFLLTYRCYILWDTKILALLIPAVLIMADMVLGDIAACETTGPGSSAAAFDSYTRTTTAWLCLSLATNLMLTMGIASRIWWLSYQIDRRISRNHQRQYRRILLIIVESGALYSSALMLFVILWVSPTNAGNYYTYAEKVSRQLVGIVPTLIIVRTQLGEHVDAFVTHGITLAVRSGLADNISGTGNQVTRNLPPHTRSHYTDPGTDSEGFVV